MVEHDMSVVFDLADRSGARLRQVIALGQTGRNPRQRAVQEAYLGALTDGNRLMLAVRDLHAYYGKSHVLRGVDLTVERRRNRQPVRAQWRRALDHLQGDHGAGRAARQRRCRGRELAGLHTDRIAHAGIGYVPEDRQIFPTLTVRQNLELGLRRSGVFGRWNFDDVFTLFPRLGERQNNGRRAVWGRTADADDGRTMMGDPD